MSVSLDGALDQVDQAYWTTQLNEDLFFLGTSIKQAQKLRTLRIQGSG